MFWSQQPYGDVDGGARVEEDHSEGGDDSQQVVHFHLRADGAFHFHDRRDQDQVLQQEASGKHAGEVKSDYVVLHEAVVAHEETREGIFARLFAENNEAYQVKKVT